MSSCRGDSVVALFAVIAIVGSIGGIKAKPPNRIRGGEEVITDEFPYAVSISQYSIKFKLDLLHKCGGAVISRRHILTAGHCIAGEGNITVHSGIINLNDKNAISSKTAKVILHPQYKPQTALQPVRNDIGILELEEDLILGGRVKKIELPVEEPRESTTDYIFAGWGKVHPDQLFDQLILKKTPITLLDDKNCFKKGQPYVTRPEVLCGYQENAALCVGDSGSPLASGGVIVGVASRSSCTTGVAHLYTNVHNYLDWIKSIIRPAPQPIVL